MNSDPTDRWRSLDPPSEHPATAARPSRCPDDEQVGPNMPPVRLKEVPRRFQLVRLVDVTGVSGTGVVADGVVWPDRTVSVRWRGERPSVVFWDSLNDAYAVHGHGGATRINWLDV